ncbi:DUF6165 family protein [Acidimicrobiia bacterium]|nr:DUF6165 family protein [Acidimicrobiia bacterium]
MKIEVSVGEVVDKYSILNIKANKISDSTKLKNVNNEIAQLEIEVENIRNINPHKFDEFLSSLIEINTALWETEDSIRILEQKQDFSDDFIKLARSVYIQNDERYRIKNLINKFYKSGVVEEKDYVEY